MNGDGRKDLAAGDSKGRVWIYLDTRAEGMPELAAGKPLLVDGKVLNSEEPPAGSGEEGEGEAKQEGRNHSFAVDYVKISLADWNGDGNGDLLVGYADATIQVFLNAGTKTEPAFKSGLSIALESSGSMARPSPVLFDWDCDGRRDLIVGTEDGRIEFFANVGEDKGMKFALGVDLEAGGLPLDIGMRMRVFVCDLNNDGIADIVAGTNYTFKNPDLPRGRQTRGNVWLIKGKAKEKAGDGEKPGEGK